MKLNKVLALALSGIMAVSMLAGCSTNGNKDDGKDKPVVTNAVEVMNKAQSKVKFSNDDTMNAALEAVAKKVTYTDIYNASYSAVAQTGSLKTAFEAKLPGEYKLGTTAPAYTSNLSAKSTNTSTVLYVVNANGLSQERALEMVATALKTSAYVDYTKGTGKNYVASYTGAVSIVTANATQENTENTATAYLIAVSVTQTVDETSNVINS